MPFIKWKLQEIDGYLRLYQQDGHNVIDAIYAGRLYQQDGYNIIDIIFLYFHLIKGMCRKICGNWVSFVILWYQLPYWRTGTKLLI